MFFEWTIIIFDLLILKFICVSFVANLFWSVDVISLGFEFTSLSKRTNRILVKAQGRDQARENLNDKAVHWLSSLGEVCFQPMTEPCSPSQCLRYNAINFCFRKVRIIHNSPRFPSDIRTSQFHGAAYFTTRPIHQWGSVEIPAGVMEKCLERSDHQEFQEKTFQKNQANCKNGWKI